MSMPKGKHQGGQTQGFPQRYTHTPFVSRSTTPQRPDVSFHVATAFPPQQGGGAGPPGGPQLRGLHHPHHGANPSIPPPHQQQPPPPSQSQHSGGPPGPAPTSTPPGPADMGKQGPPHLPGQPQMPQGGQMQINFGVPNQQRPNQSQPYFAGPRGPTPRMPNHRGQVVNMSTNNVGQQIYPSHVPVPQMPIYPGHVVPTPLNPNQMLFASGQMPMYPAQPRHQNTGTSYYPSASQQQQLMMQQHQLYGGFQSGPQGHQFFFQSMRGGGVGGATGVGAPGLGTNANQQVVVPGAPPQMGQGGQVPMLPLTSGSVIVPGIAGDSGGPAGPVGAGGGNKQQRRKFALDIVDPNTMQNVDVYETSGGNTPPRSGDSSARETPQPTTGPGDLDVAADFAARVAKVASESSAPSPAQPSYSEPPSSIIPPLVLNVNGPEHIGMNSVVTTSEGILSQADASVSKSQIVVLEESTASQPSWKPQTQPKASNLGNKNISNKNNKIDISMNKGEDHGHIKVESDSNPLVKPQSERERSIPPGVPNVSAKDVPSQQVTDIPIIASTTQQIIKDHQSLVPTVEPVIPQDVTPVVSALTNSPDVELIHHRSIPREQYPSKSSGISIVGSLQIAHSSPRRKRGDHPTVTEKASVALVPNISVVSSQVTPAPMAEVKQREHSVPPTIPQLVSEPKQKKSESVVDEPPSSISVATKERRDQDKSSRGREKSSQGRDTQGREKSRGQDREKSLQGRSKENPVVSISVASALVPQTEVVVQSISKSSTKPVVVSTSRVVLVEDNKHQSNGETLDGTDGKSTQKSKHKRLSKMRDYNRKGAEKEGTDMDAFSEPPLEEVPPVTDTSSSAPVAATTNKVTENPVIKNEESETDKEEEKLVAARNEENTKVSAAALKEDSPVIENTPAKTTSVTLKYSYKEDQWSPLNPDGKKKYERDFLMGLKNEPHSKKKPDNLPDIEVVLKDKQPRAIDLSRGQHDTFTPKFLAGSNSRGGPLPKRNSQSKAKGNKSGLIHVSLSLKEDVKLNAAENAWRPGRMSKSNVAAAATAATAPPEQDAKTADLYKKVRGVLNRLTPQKFQTLVEQVQSLPIDNSDRLQGVINLVFEKAVDEPGFSVAYAQMCKVLSDMQVPDHKAKDETAFVNFRKLLVNRCQHEFEKNTELELNSDVKLKEIENTTDPEKKKELQLIYNEEERRVRMKSVGNIRFIGELFKLQMLTTNIMNRCIKKLLSDGHEESLECLCKLLTTIGKDLETKKQDLSAYFSKMNEIIHKKGAVSSRVRFMLQDVIELRQGKWVPRRDDSNPKTIDQIQREAEKESLESQLALSSAPPTPRRQDDRGGGNDRRKNRGGNMADDGWSLAGRSKNNSYLVDTTRLKQKVPELDSVSLGNRSTYTNWHHSQVKTDTGKKLGMGMVSTNFYEALQDMTGDEKKAAPMYSSSSPRPGPGSGKCTPSASMEKERMLAMFKTNNEETLMSRGISALQSSRSSSRENSSRGTEDACSVSSQPLSVTSIEDVSKSPDSSMVAEVTMTSDQISKKTTLLLEEFINNSSLEETAQSVAETFGSSTIHQFLVECLNVVLEKSSPARQRVGILMCHLIKENVVTLSQYLNGFAEMLESADDLTIDVPKIWLYLAEVIAPMLSSETLSFPDFREVARTGSKLLPEVLQLLVKDKGPAWICEKWNAANMKWTDFVEPDQVDSFVKQYKLEYVSGDGSDCLSPTSPLNMEEVQKKLVQFLKQESGSTHSFDQICDWIGANVGDKVTEPQFIRALMTAVCESAVSQSSNSVKLNEAVLLNHIKFFQKYVDNKEELELQCLYAVQAFSNRLEHPQGLLCNIFQCLSENSLIPDETFTTWETSTDPCEQVGKGVALKSLTTFFTALREAEEESEES